MSKGFVILSGFIAVILTATSWVAGQQASTSRNTAATPGPLWVEGKGLKCGIDRGTGLPAQLETQIEHGSVDWLHAPVRLQVLNEATNAKSSIAGQQVEPVPQGANIAGTVAALSLDLKQQWRSSPSGITWDLTFAGNGTRAGHEVILELPILSPASQVFTPC